tara:strand:- start:3206 stop:4198 length:993 start_codon:yes stop_codon:yes gene_type:complete
MIKYNIDYIDNLYNDISNNKLNNDVCIFLKITLENINKLHAQYIDCSNNSNYNNMKNFKNQRSTKGRYYKSKNNDNPVLTNNVTAKSNFKINRIKDINNKSEYELNVDNIRKLLNKLTINNFEKLKTELLCAYKTIFYNLNTKDFDSLNKIDIFIFESFCYNNKLYSLLYCDLFSDLISISKNFEKILYNNTEIFINITNSIKFSNTIKFDEINEINKHNDKHKCFCIFIINCLRKNLLPNDIILKGISNLQNELSKNINLPGNKLFCEEITEFIKIIISESYPLIKNLNEYTDIYKKIEFYSILKPNMLPSICNKIIFKHLDLFEKYVP